MAKTFKRLQKPEEKTISFDSPAVIKEDNVFFKEDSPLGMAESFGQSLKRTLIPPGSFGTAGVDKFEETIPDDYLSEKEIDNIAYDAKIAAAMRAHVAQEDQANRVFGTSVGGLATEGYGRELAAGIGFPAGAFASTATALGGGSLIDLLFGELTEGREDKGRAVSERIRSYMAESQRSQVRYPSDYKGNRPFKNTMSDEAFNTWKRSSIQALAQAPLMLSAPLIGWEGVVGTHVFGQTYDSYEEYTAAGGSKQLGMLYGLANGVVEYGVTKAFQFVGLAGLEQAFKAGRTAIHPAKQAMMREVAAKGLLSKFGVTAKGTPAALASFASTATPEAIEETMIAVMQNSLRATSGLDPNAADFENQWKAAVDASITSMLMTGAMNTAALSRGTWNKDTQQWTPDGDVQLRDVDLSPMQLAMNDPTGGIPVVEELNLGLDLTEDQRAELEEDYKKSKQQDVEQSEKQMEREKALTEAKSVSSSLNKYTEEVTDVNGDVVEVETPADAQNVRVTLNTDVDSIEYDILSYMIDENKLKLIDDDGNLKFSKLTDVSLTDEQVKKNIEDSDILSPVPEGTRSVFGRAETEPDPTVAPVLNDNTETIQDKIDASTKENMTAEEYLDYLTQRRLDQGEDLEQESVFLPDDAEAQDRSVFDVAGRDSRLDAQEAQEQYELLAEFASRNNLPEQWLQENDPRRKDSVFNESNEAPVQPEADPIRDVIQVQEEAKDVNSLIERTKTNAEAAIRQEIEERYPVESYTPVSQQFLERIIRDRLEQQFLMFSQSGTDINSLSLKLQLDLGATDADVQAALVGLQSQGLAQVDSTSNKILPSKKFVDSNRKELLEGEVGEVSEGRSYSEYVVEQNPINTDLLAFDLDQTGDATRMAKTKDGPIAVNIQRNQDGSHMVTLTKPEKFKGQREVFDADISSKDVAESAVGMLHDAIEFHGLPDSKSPQEQAELNDPNDAGWESYFNYLGVGLARNAGKALLEAGQVAVGAARGAASGSAQDIALSRMARRGARAFNDAYRNTIEYLTGKKKRPDGTVRYRDFLEAVKKDKERGFPTILDDEVDLVRRDAVVKGLFDQPWFITPDEAGVVDRGPLYQIGTKAEDTADTEAQEKTAEEVEAEKKRQFTIAKRFMEAIGQGMSFNDFIRAQEFGFEGTIEDIESGLLTEEQLRQLSKAIGEIVDLDIKQQRESEEAKKAEAAEQQEETSETTQDTEVEDQKPVSEVKVEDEVEEEEEVTPPSGENHDIFVKLFTNNEAGGFLSSTEPVYVEYEGEGTYEVLNYRTTDGQMTIVDEDGVESTWNIMDGEFSIVKTEQASDEPVPEDMQDDEQVDTEIQQDQPQVKKKRRGRSEGTAPQPKSKEQVSAIVEQAKKAAREARKSGKAEESPATKSPDDAMKNVLNALMDAGVDVVSSDEVQGRDFSADMPDELYSFDDSQTDYGGVYKETESGFDREDVESQISSLRESIQRTVNEDAPDWLYDLEDTSRDMLLYNTELKGLLSIDQDRNTDQNEQGEDGRYLKDQDGNLIERFADLEVERAAEVLGIDDDQLSNLIELHNKIVDIQDEISDLYDTLESPLRSTREAMEQDRIASVVAFQTQDYYFRSDTGRSLQDLLDEYYTRPLKDLDEDTDEFPYAFFGESATAFPDADSLPAYARETVKELSALYQITDKYESSQEQVTDEETGEQYTDTVNTYVNPPHVPNDEVRSRQKPEQIKTQTSMFGEFEYSKRLGSFSIPLYDSAGTSIGISSVYKKGNGLDEDHVLLVQKDKKTGEMLNALVPVSRIKDVPKGSRLELNITQPARDQAEFENKKIYFNDTNVSRDQLVDHIEDSYTEPTDEDSRFYTVDYARDVAAQVKRIEDAEAAEDRGEPTPEWLEKARRNSELTGGEYLDDSLNSEETAGRAVFYRKRKPDELFSDAELFPWQRVGLRTQDGEEAWVASYSPADGGVFRVQSRSQNGNIVEKDIKASDILPQSSTKKQKGIVRRETDGRDFSDEPAPKRKPAAKDLLSDTVVDALVDLMALRLQEGVSLKDIVTETMSHVAPDARPEVVKPLKAAYGFVKALSNEDLSQSQIEEVFHPYIRTANVQQNADGLEGGQGGAGVGSQGRTGDSSTEGSRRDTVGGVPESAGDQAGAGSGERGLRRRKVQEDVATADSTADSTRRRRLGDRSPDDATVSGLPDGDAGLEGGRLSDEDRADRRSERRAKFDAELRSVSRQDFSGDVASVPYQNVSGQIVDKILVPTNHADAVASNMRKIQDRYYYLPNFVAKETGLDQTSLEDFSAMYDYQLEGVAAAIAAHKRGESYILGWQTGIGKGRVVASVMQYARKQGLLPVFVTDRPDLFSSMMEDTYNIGAIKEDGDFIPFITNNESESTAINLNANIEGFGERKQVQNKSESEASMERMSVRKGRLVDGDKKYDAIFTTYDQMRPSKGLTYRNNFINNIAERAFFILDESHKIGEGKGRNADGTEKLSTGSFLRDAIAASQGALFSSATFSKTSDQIKTYVTAGLEKSLDDPTQLGDLLSSMGDAGLQIFSQGLADNGTYSRLERDMADVEVTTKQVTTVPEQVDAISQSLASLQDAQVAIKSSLKSSIEKVEGGLFGTDASSFIDGLPEGKNKGRLNEYTKPKSTSGIPFLPTKLKFAGQPQHQNVITTAITAMKVEAAADDIITQVKAGKKVVAVFDSTMESALNKFVRIQDIGVGGEVNFNLKSVLLQQVEEARRVEVLFERKTSDENGDRIINPKSKLPLEEKKRVRVRLEDSELSKEALAAIDKARSLINSLPDDIAGSPIDGVAKRLTEAGIQFAELTGRKRVIDYSSGKPIYAARDDSEASSTGKKAVQDRFNNDPQLKVILANRSIATGMNLQASFGFADQSQRHMTLIEIAKDINALMQLLGRINRANQSSVPTYSFMLTDSPTEIRVASMFSKKLRSLSASVSADGESSINPDMPDYMNFVGEYVLNDVLLQMKHEGIDLLEQMGRKKGLVLNGEEAVLKQREGDLSFFNEITSKLNFFPIAAQNEVWSRMERAYQSELESLAMAGDSPLKAKLYDFKAKTLDFEVVKAPRNAAAKEGVFGSGVRLQRVSAKNDGGILTEFAIEKRIADTLKGKEPAQFTAELMDTVISEHESYMEDRKARIAEIGIDAEARTRELNTSASSRINIIQSVLDTPVGSHVVLTTKTRNASNGQLEDYNVPAVILEHVRRGQSEDPANLSDFYVRVAVPDERGVAQISYEQISQGRFAISDPSLTRKDTLKVFTDKTKGGRIERYIATGDAVAALEQFKGYGVPGFYTNDRGEQRAGVILHRDFDPEIWRENRPASISNPNSAAMALVEGIPLRFLDGKAQITGRSDGLHIQMPFEAKGNGVSKIKKSLEDAGLKFGKSEDGLTAFINKPYSKDRLWESVVKRIIDNAGGSVVAARNHSLARQIIRDVEGLDDPRVMEGRDLFRSSRRRKKDQPLASEELNPHTEARREINFWNEVTTGGQIHVNNKDAENIIVQSKSLVNSLATIFDLKNWEGGVAGRDVHAWYQGAKKHQKYGTGEIVTAKHASARIGVRLHEIAHALDDRYSITKDQLTDEQLEKIKYLDPSIARVEEGKGRVREGWAEFVRRMFTQSSVNPEDSRVEFAERIGNFDLQEFMDEMTNWMADFANKKENSALKKQLKKARKLMNAYRDQPLANKLDSMVNVQPVDDLALSPMERASRWAAGLGRKVMFHFDDDLNEVMRFDRASVNSVNANRMALEDLVASKRHQANEQGRLAQILGVFDPNTNEMISSSGVISDFHGGIQSFFDMRSQIAVGQNKRQQIQYKNRAKVFAWARHAAWLADQEWAQDYEAGMGVEEAVAFMNEIKKDPEMYNDYIKMSEEISDQGLKYLKVALRTGGLDPNMYRFLYERYHRSKNYFPMYRIRNQENSLAMDLSASGINFTKNPLKGRSRYGNGDPVEDPLVSLESMAVDVYHKSAQTTITKEIYQRLDSGRDASLGQFARVRDKSTKITQQRMEDIVKQLVERGIVSDRDASLFRAAHRMRQGLEKIGYKLGDQVTAPVVSKVDMNNLASGLGFSKNDPDLPTKLARVGFVPSSKLPSLEGFVSTFTQVYDKPRTGEELRVVWVPVGVDPNTKEPILKEVQIELIPEFAESLSSLKPIEKNVFFMFMSLGYQSIRTSATGTFSFFVKDLPRNISSALARTDIEESPYLPFYNTLKGTIKEFHNRYGVELVRRAASKVPILNQTGWINPPTELQDMDSLYVLMEKQGGSAFTKLGSFVKGSRSRKRVERSLMSVPLDSRSTALDMIFNGGARAGLLQSLKSPEGDAINLKGVTLERVLSGLERVKDATTDKMANYFDAMQRFANASDKPTRLINARNKLNELGYTALTGNSFINPDGDKVSGLPQEVLVAVIAAYQSGGLNHVRGGRFNRHTSRYVNFLNTNWHSVITDAVLMKRGALDPIAEKLLPEKVSRRIVGRRKEGLSDAKARHMTILAAKYLPLMAYSVALSAMYRLFNDEEEHYENAPEKRKDGAWLLGSQGKTLLEIRRSSQFRPAQDLGIYLAESFLESERSKGRGSLGEIMLENTKAPVNQLQSSFYGGPLGIMLQVASNKTYFETPITPSFMQSNFSPTQQFLPNTTWLARKGSEIGYGMTGLKFMTPLNIDHVMEGMTARLWGWGHDVVGGTFDQTMKMYDVATGEKRMADYVSQFPAEEILQGMPMLGTAFPYRTEVEPIYSLQAALDEQQTVVNDHQQMGMSGSESARIARRESAFLDKFNDLVKGLNQLQHQMEDGKEDIKRLAVGTARQALGLRTQDNFQSVLTRDRDSLPKEVVDVVDQFLDLTIDRTLRVSARGKIESSDVPLLQQKLEYLEHVDNVAAFVREISDMPYVAGYLRSKYTGSRMSSLSRSLYSKPEKDGDLNPHQQRKYDAAYDETTFRVRRLLKDLKAIR